LKQLITYIGLDVHKETIAVALAEAGKRSEVREYGKIANTPAAVRRWLRSWHAMATGCGSAMRPGLAVTAFSDN
jgi:hypothetical protein